MTSYEKIKALAEMVEALMREMDRNFPPLFPSMSPYYRYKEVLDEMLA